MSKVSVKILRRLVSALAVSGLATVIVPVAASAAAPQSGEGRKLALIIAISDDHSVRLLQRLRSGGDDRAAAIGRVTGEGAGRIRVV